MYPMAPSPPCHHMDEPHPPVCLWENSEALYTMIFKHQRELKRKQQRVCGYVIQLCGPLRMFFDEDVSALYDENQPLFTVATNQLRTKTDKTKISLKDDYRYQYCKEKNSMQSSLPFHQP
ncbi:unnamed protein product, partial [Brassica oleracea var. botrytis]